MQDVEKKQLTWFGHIKQMPETRLPKQVSEWQPTTRQKREKPKLEWLMTIHKSVSERNLIPEDCDDRRKSKLGVRQTTSKYVLNRLNNAKRRFKSCLE
ncbi:hypothetical protein ILUMI_06124 [Ignelater luminosus]|uniref:Uncharacterized protein n=1 Tax=Ignelater luminosus TaxID=2038154 RepID=A0A8K0DAL8_IGNLU|nr:hypothetical protein ILUMI_06124 [Ignelater luminosus]